MSKEYYRAGVHSKWKLSYMKEYTLREIAVLEPPVSTVFEFGCGRGENLKLLEHLGYKVYGLDINPDEVKHANKKGLGGVSVGDETDIRGMKGIDLSFTMGVLDHLPEDEFIVAITSLQEITERCIFCLETNDIPAEHYYPHNYMKYGFQLVKTFKPNGGDGAVYALWRRDANP